MKKILVAINTGREGGNDLVLETADTLAKAMDGELILVHAIEMIPAYVAAEISMVVINDRRDEVEAEMAGLAAKCQNATSVVLDGTPANRILEYAEEIGADLIVIPSHDPDLSTYFIGSVAGRIVRHAHCSVHVVCEAAD